jgi:putative transposase
LTEAVRIVTHVARGVQVSAGGVYVWRPKYRRPVLTGRVAARCEGLNHARAREHGWPIVALKIMPDHMHIFVKAHRPDSPFLLADLFKGFTSRRLQAEFPQLRSLMHRRSRPPALWFRPYFTATVGALPAETVCRFADTQHRRPWRKEQPQ